MKILKLPQVMEATALSRSSIYAFIKKGNFPPQFRLSERAVGWESDAINQWLEERIAASRGGANE